MMFDKELWGITRESDMLEIYIQPPYQYKEYTVEDFVLYGVVEIEEITSFEKKGHVIKCFRLHFPEKKSIEELKEIQEALAQRKDIYSVQLRHGYWLDAVPDDYNSVDLWGLAKASIPEAWDINTGSATVYVGVVDTGIDASHPDLQNRVNTSFSQSFIGSDPDENELQSSDEVLLDPAA